MAGHSKWKNIAHRKNAMDAKRAKVFTKYAREMAIAIRSGGPDPNANSKLKDIIAKAKADNVPNDNIARTLQKYQSGAQAENYEYITYEGYGPQGVAIIVETLTDNRNRTVGEVRHYFDKYGGNIGASGCVSWQFERMGVITALRGERDEDAALLLALEAGADDVIVQDDLLEIRTAPDALDEVKANLLARDCALLEAELALVPGTTVAVQGDEAVKNLTKLLELLESNDDVQSVWHNWES